MNPNHTSTHRTNQGADGNPDFSHAHAFMTTSGAQAGGVTDVKTGPDGYLYVADYAGACGCGWVLLLKLVGVVTCWCVRLVCILPH